MKGQRLAKILAESNCQDIDQNLIAKSTAEENLRSIQDAQDTTMKVNTKFKEYEWYKYIFYYVVNMECP